MLSSQTPVEVGLLSVSRQIRQVTVPIFYGDSLFTLMLPVSMIAFFEDRGLFAQENIKTLCIGQINPNAANEEAEQTLWEDNFAYIKKWLTGLQSLRVHVRMPLEDGERLDRSHQDSEHVDVVLQRSNMRWFVALAKLRGLRDVSTVYMIATWLAHLHYGFKGQIQVLQQYLQSQVFQPRVEEDNLSPR